ncbi:NAD(P)/FAD-dependent oxidoreductase [Halobaculum marinum]|uniref:NAD(P)/FAD-dependent oxidoreductase n=1 Tax=Halobaculum marinum TaxID=3031996 RepID=A0ABD5WT25_9EURY|nr:FAD-dependent oxidoreductase [Halobaculum sp. DT55]
MAHIGIVGAGVAGAGAAYALRETAHDMTLLEKSRGVGGRAATRRRNDCRYDHGANYVKDADDRTLDLLHELGEEGLVDVEEPVWTFGVDGQIEPSNRQESHKFTWTAGITQLAKRLLAETDAEVRKTTRAASLARDDEGETWTVTDTDGDEHGPFDALLLTPPAPQTADLLAATEWVDDDGALDELHEAVAATEFRTIRTLVLHYDFAVDRPWYAAVDVDKEHDVGWVAREECKDGHVPDGESLLIVQMGPEWSTEHYDDPLEEAADAVAGRVADLVGDDRLTDPDWVDDQGWRYALPDTSLDPDADAVDPAADAGLYLAGDWVAGEGRVHRALWNGVEVGERVGDSL